MQVKISEYVLTDQSINQCSGLPGIDDLNNLIGPIIVKVNG